MKKCGKCLEYKPFDSFYKDKNRKYGLGRVCKICDEIRKIEYYRTEAGYFSRVYCEQVKNSKKRGNNPPTYSKEELSTRIKSQENFKELWGNRVGSGYLTSKRPSVDRIDDHKGYFFGNIRLVTWYCNNKKSYSDRKSGKNRKKMRPVLQLSLKGDLIKRHYSISQAGRELNIAYQNIFKACVGVYKQSGGFKWEYATE